MQSQDEKLGKFLQAINEYSEKQRQRILSELEEQNKIELERAEKETLSDAYRMIQLQTSDVRSSISRELSARELQSRKKLLEQRAEIECDIFARAADRLKQFTATEDYRGYLTDCAKTAAQAFSAAPGETVFRLRPDDMAYKLDITAAFGGECAVEADKSIVIGGVLCINSRLGKAINATLDSRLEQQRDWFCENSGLLVY